MIYKIDEIFKIQSYMEIWKLIRQGANPKDYPLWMMSYGLDEDEIEMVKPTKVYLNTLTNYPFKNTIIPIQTSYIDGGGIYKYDNDSFVHPIKPRRNFGQLHFVDTYIGDDKQEVIDKYNECVMKTYRELKEKINMYTLLKNKCENDLYQTDITIELLKY